jgi:hypothetical protein
MRGFEGFSDSPDAPFYRSGAKSSQATWAEATRRLGLVLESAIADAERRPTLMTVERVCGWHRAIFLTTFPRDAGRVRDDHEPVSFGVPLEFEGEMRNSPIHGVLPRSAILERLSVACATTWRAFFGVTAWSPRWAGRGLEVRRAVPFFSAP